MKSTIVCRCEELNRTPLHAAYFYLNAGRVFAHTSTSEKSIKYFTAEEFVTEAMDAFKNSIEIYETHAEYSMCATLCFELAQMLSMLEKYEESGLFYMRSFAYASPNYNFQYPEEHDQLTWQERHHLLFSENHATTQLQTLRNAVSSYLKTSDYEIVTQILQLQQTLLTQQYQSIISAPDTPTPKPTNGTAIRPTLPEKSTVPSLFNSMATLLYTERVNVSVTLLFVLLIQKRKAESTKCMEELRLTLSPEDWEQSNTTSFFADNVLPLIEELYDACLNDRVTHVVYIIEQQILHHSLDNKQIQLLNDLRHVYENPLFL
jgi:tetratricopeptide (TPR) repeat protein